MKSKKIFKLLTVLILSLMLFSNFVYADETNLDELNATMNEYDVMLIDELEEQENIEPDTIDTISDDVYMADEGTVTLEKNVDGNVYAFGEKVEISSAEINGNVFIFAQEIVLDKAYVTGSLFLAGEKIIFNCFATDVYAAGSKIYINEDARILRDVRAAGESIEVYGVISRNTFLAADTIKINEKGIIEGNLEYSSSKEAGIQGSVYGATEFSKVEEEVVSQKEEFTSYVESIVEAMIYSIVIVLFVVFVIPKFIKNSRIKFIEAFGTGIGFLIIVPIIIIILLISVFGIPSSFLILAIYIIMLTVGYTISAIAIADKIYNNFNKESDSKLQLFIITLLVLLVLNIISTIPIIGGIISFVLTMIGIGIIILNIIKSR